MADYRICGLNVSSELELTGAVAIESTTFRPDVTIQYGVVPQSLVGPSATGPTWELANEEFLLRVPRLARMLIASGRTIIVERETDVSERDVSGFVLGTALGVLLHQRGALVLHGSAVARDGRAIAICGPSGAGKSTLAAALCREGYSFVTDDLCVVGLNERREPIILPDGRKLKLWKESITQLDLSGRRGDAVRDQFEKYYIEPLTAAQEPPRLSAIYVLREARPPLKHGVEELALPDALRTLEYEAYRPGLRALMANKPEMLVHAATILGHARIFVLARPRGFEHMSQVVSQLHQHWGALD